MWYTTRLLVFYTLHIFLKLYTGSTPSSTVAMLSFKDAAKAVVAMGVATKKDPECVRVVVRCSPASAHEPCLLRRHCFRVWCLPCGGG